MTMYEFPKSQSEKNFDGESQAVSLPPSTSTATIKVGWMSYPFICPHVPRAIYNLVLSGLVVGNVDRNAS